jgi:hypothetical protein
MAIGSIEANNRKVVGQNARWLPTLALLDVNATSFGRRIQKTPTPLCPALRSRLLGPFLLAAARDGRLWRGSTPA